MNISLFFDVGVGVLVFVILQDLHDLLAHLVPIHVFLAPARKT